jgi:outer membrane lipopolysaccharide assembly protein LptE/RlpB
VKSRMPKSRMTTSRAFFLVASALMLSACGYQVGGQGSLLPKDAHTIAVAPWGNASIHYTLSNYLAASVSRELISRTRYRMVSDPSKADLILYGSVANMTAGGTLYDNTSGRTTGGQISVWIQYRLVDHAGKVLLNIPNMEFHQPYEISVNPTQYFDESEAAMQRLSTEVAKSIVSSLLEQF